MIIISICKLGHCRKIAVREKRSSFLFQVYYKKKFHFPFGREEEKKNKFELNAISLVFVRTKTVSLMQNNYWFIMAINGMTMDAAQPA